MITTELEELLLEEHGLKLFDMDVITVREEIAKHKNDIEIGESDGCEDSVLLAIKELQEFENYNCIIAYDAEYGACDRMEYVIVSDDGMFIGLVRII